MLDILIIIHFRETTKLLCYVCGNFNLENSLNLAMINLGQYLLIILNVLIVVSQTRFNVFISKTKVLDLKKIK